MIELSDQQIINKVLSGDIDYFKKIIERYQQRVFSIGMRLFNNEADSHDFVQEVFMKAYSKLSTNKSHASFRCWLMKIAYNHGINMVKSQNIRSRKSVELHPCQEIVALQPCPHEVQLQKEVKETLLAAIRKLPQTYQICLDSYFFMGLTYAQINEITGMPVNTIKSHVFRAKQLLHNALRGTIVENYHEM